MTNLEIIYKQSTHCRERITDIKYIIIHSSSLKPLEMIKTFNDLGLSSHYIIGRKGEIYETVSPYKVAYHAGVSSWQKSKGLSLNDCSIGIELEAPFLGNKTNDFTKKQITALVWLLDKLIIEHKISPYNILGHSDIAPTRKADPGVFFPWRKLSKLGLGVWFDLRKTIKNNNEKELLEIIGYNTDDINASRVSFCRHYNRLEIDCNLNVCDLIQKPVEDDFRIKDYSRYMKILKAVAYSYNKII